MIIVGCIVAATGVVRGNMAANRIWDEMTQRAKAQGSMFSTGEEIGSGSIQGKRWDALRKYRAEQPHGSELLSVRFGRILSLVGMLVILVGFFV